MKVAWGWLAVILLIAVLAGSALYGFHTGMAFDVCQVDDEVSNSDRATITEASWTFVNHLRAGESTLALDSMSPRGRAATERIALVQLAETAAENGNAPLEVRRVFKLTSIGSPRGWATCRDQEGAALVARGGGLQTMFVVVAEPLLRGERTWSMWFERERGVWRVRGVHLGLSAMAGRTGAQLWAMAVEQRQKNNTFNSTLLYDLANTVLYRGGFLQLPEARGFAEERQLYRRHQDVIQARFHLGNGTFPMARMHAVATDAEGFVLVLDQHLDAPLSVDDAIGRNRALIDGMNAYRPEWREVFDALASGSPTGPNRLWRTVFKRDGGYVQETGRL